MHQGVRLKTHDVFYNNSSDLTLEQRISGLTSNNVIIDRATSSKNIVGLCQGRKIALRTFVVSFEVKSFKHEVSEHCVIV